MNRILSAALAVAGAALISVSASTFAADEQALPFSVNDTGPVLTTEQQAHIAKSEHKATEGVAGRPGLPMAARQIGPGYEDYNNLFGLRLPSAGGPIDD